MHDLIEALPRELQLVENVVNDNDIKVACLDFESALKCYYGTLMEPHLATTVTGNTRPNIMVEAEKALCYRCCSK